MDELLNVTVTVANRGENSYNSRVILTYPAGLSYRKFTIQQIGIQSAKFLLTSTATVEYDKEQYIYFSTGSYNNPPVRKIVAEVEVYPKPDFTKAIVGGCLGGLAILALLTAGLYKAGFFKSKYKQMMKESAEDGPGNDASALTVE
ncbi:trace amine associated receptor [Sarotherodon galilaeus]